jgi:hypothetical protein
MPGCENLVTATGCFRLWSASHTSGDLGRRALARAPWISGKIHQGVMPITSGARAPRYEGAGDHRMVTDEEKIPFAGKYVSADLLVLYCSKSSISIF